jgi:hypothetical protein
MVVEIYHEMAQCDILPDLLGVIYFSAYNSGYIAEIPLDNYNS